MTEFETALLIRLRIARWGKSKEAAAEGLHEAMRERGMSPVPKVGSLRSLIYRIEKGRTADARSAAFPVYLDLLGVESQRPALEALAETVGQDVVAMRRELTAAVELIREIRDQVKPAAAIDGLTSEIKARRRGKADEQAL